MTDAALYCLVIGVLYGRLASALVYRRRLRRANENGSRWLNRAVVAEGQNVALREREQRRDLRDTAALHRAFPMNATPSVPARFRCTCPGCSALRASEASAAADELIRASGCRLPAPSEPAS